MKGGFCIFENSATTHVGLTLFIRLFVIMRQSASIVVRVQLSSASTATKACIW
jgi:hypothetical protein